MRALARHVDTWVRSLTLGQCLVFIVAIAGCGLALLAGGR